MSAALYMDRAASGKVVVSRLDNARVLKGGALSRTAAMMCTNSRFQRFVVSIAGGVPAGITARQHAADFIRRSCEITSRVMLDHDARAACLFHEMVRKPFVQWQERHP